MLNEQKKKEIIENKQWKRIRRILENGKIKNFSVVWLESMMIIVCVMMGTWIRIRFYIDLNSKIVKTIWKKNLESK